MALTRAGLSETLRSRLNHTTDTDTEINFCQGSFNSCIRIELILPKQGLSPAPEY